jgi:hypothetical protein
MRRRRRKALATGIALFALGVGVGATGSTFSAFSSTTSTPTSSFSSAPDWTAPTVGAKAIGKATGGTPAGGKPGAVKTNGTFYAYANVSDSGNPSQGIGSVTVDLTSVNGQSAVALTTTGGPWTVDGTTYNYRSAQLTATKAPGTFNVPLTASDNDSNSTSGVTIPVTIDNTAPSASGVQTVNHSGGVAGKAEAGDQVVLTFSEQIDPYSVIPSTSWNGTTAANVVVHLNNGGGANDNVTIFNAANSTQINLGSINLGGKNYSTSNITFGATGTASTMVQSGSTITITLGTQSAAATTATTATAMTWTPSISALDIAGNAMSATAKAETGGSDVEF